MSIWCVCVCLDSTCGQSIWILAPGLPKGSRSAKRHCKHCLNAQSESLRANPTQHPTSSATNGRCLLKGNVFKDNISWTAPNLKTYICQIDGLDAEPKHGNSCRVPNLQSPKPEPNLETIEPRKQKRQPHE